MDYEKFDRSLLSPQDKSLLIDLANRRKTFDGYIKENNINKFTCPGCSYPSLDKRGYYEICSVCNWEDDHQDDDRADEVWGGPNYDLSLTQNRLNIAKLLNHLADSLGGSINEDPKEVLLILDYHSDSLSSLLKNLPDTEESSDEKLQEYMKSTENLLEALIKRN